MRLAFLRDLPWFTPDRAAAWCRVLFAILVLTAALFVAGLALPLIAIPISNATLVSLGPPVVAALAANIYRRALARSANLPI